MQSSNRWLVFAFVPLYIAAGFGLRHENVDENPPSMNLLSLLCIFSIIAAVLVPGTSAFFFVSDKILLLLLVTRKDIWIELMENVQSLCSGGGFKRGARSGHFFVSNELLKKKKLLKWRTCRHTKSWCFNNSSCDLFFRNALVLVSMMSSCEQHDDENYFIGNL